MKKVILLLCMVLLLGVALSSCATANGSSAASALLTAPSPVQSAPSAVQVSYEQGVPVSNS